MHLNEKLDPPSRNAKLTSHPSTSATGFSEAIRKTPPCIHSSATSGNWRCSPVFQWIPEADEETQEEAYLPRTIHAEHGTFQTDQGLINLNWTKSTKPKANLALIQPLVHKPSQTLQTILWQTLDKTQVQFASQLENIQYLASDTDAGRLVFDVHSGHCHVQRKPYWRTNTVKTTHQGYDKR